MISSAPQAVVHFTFQNIDQCCVGTDPFLLGPCVSQRKAPFVPWVQLPTQSAHCGLGGGEAKGGTRAGVPPVPGRKAPVFLVCKLVPGIQASREVRNRFRAAELQGSTVL